MDKIERPKDEINFSDLINNPLRSFGLVFPIILILVIAGGMYWVFNMDTAFINKIPEVKLMRDTGATEIETKKGSVVAGINIDEYVNSTPKLIEQGKELYNTNCATCHGAEGKGDGIAGVALNPKPRDFTHKEGWKNGLKLTEMYKTLEEGITGSGMVPYNFLPVTSRLAMIHYIHSLMGDYPQNSKEELTKLDQDYNLSKGQISPNQISIAKAMQILIKENANKVNNDVKTADTTAKSIKKKIKN